MNGKLVLQKTVSHPQKNGKVRARIPSRSNPMASSSKIIARVEELNRVCPGNALVWEFVQNKDLEVTELADRIHIMLARQQECASDPQYIERTQSGGYDARYRKKVVELYLKVSTDVIPRT
jgi:hypothetical protein